MNTQKVKQAHEMTNKELFAELKERGFFLFPFTTEGLGDTDLDFENMVVGVKEPTRDIFYRLHQEFYMKNKETILKKTYID